MNTPPQDYEAAITQIIRRLSEAHLLVIRTFDLKSACAERPGSVCPHHSTAPCDCQMTVLLIYNPSSAPVTLMVRWCDGQLQFSLEYLPQQQPDSDLETVILQALIFDHVHAER